MTDYQKYADAFFDYVPPKQFFHDQFSESFDENLNVAPNIFDNIQHEVTYGEKDFQYISGRVDAYVGLSNAPKLGDDYKNFIFSNQIDKMFVGKLFKWKNSYWLAVNTNSLEGIGNSCVVRRCNNMLKWIDKKGNLIKEPCIMADTIKQANDYSSNKLTIVSGFTGFFCQKNKNTNLIVSNQRFLFGTPENWKAFKVFGDGVKNYLNSATEDNMSPSIIEFTVGGSFVSYGVDDIENGIANRFADKFMLTINESSYSDSVGDYRKLTATAKNEGIMIASPSFMWASSDPSVANVDSEGNVELLSLGSATITCTLGENDLINDTIEIEVVEIKADVLEIIIDPPLGEVDEGDSKTFNARLYVNGIKADDTITFSVGGLVPSKHYHFSIVGENSFMIQNREAYYSAPLIIHCQSGLYEYDFKIDLNGAW